MRKVTSILQIGSSVGRLFGRLRFLEGPLCGSEFGYLRLGQSTLVESICETSDWGIIKASNQFECCKKI